MTSAESGAANQSTTERESPSVDGLVIGIFGGTGEQGRGLARRFAMAGHPVIIGSRIHDRAHAVAREVGHGVPWPGQPRRGPRGEPGDRRSPL